jgi:hypothetical protein
MNQDQAESRLAAMIARQKRSIHPSFPTDHFRDSRGWFSTNYKYMIQGRGFLIVDDRPRQDTSFRNRRGALHLAENEALIPLMHRCAAGPGLIIDYLIFDRFENDARVVVDRR